MHENHQDHPPAKPAMNIQKELFETRRSALRAYQELAVGSSSWLALLRYEFMQMFLSGLPGALGLVLRRWAYRRWLGSMGRNVAIGKGVVIRHPAKIRIGDNVAIDDHCLLDAKGADNRGIDIGSNVVIGRQSILHCKNGDIALGDHVNIGVNCDITSSNQVEIGAKTLIAAYAYIVGGDHDISCADTALMDQGRVGKGIAVEADCWIGAHAVVLDGVRIGSGSIVGAGGVVNRSLPPKSVSAGIPARVLRDRDTTQAARADSTEAGPAAHSADLKQKDSS